MDHASRREPFLRDEPALGGLVFVKRYALPDVGDEHVDLGCNVEVFTDARMLELETLRPRVPLRRGETVVHVERWSPHRLALPDDDQAAERAIEDAVRALVPFHAGPIGTRGSRPAEGRSSP